MGLVGGDDGEGERGKEERPADGLSGSAVPARSSLGFLASARVVCRAAVPPDDSGPLEQRLALRTRDGHTLKVVLSSPREGLRDCVAEHLRRKK